jgi:hypothetical protein
MNKHVFRIKLHWTPCKFFHAAVKVLAINGGTG